MSTPVAGNHHDRFDTTVSSWMSFNYIAFMVILLKKVKKRKKFR
jgi:hypothetical protein